MNLRSIVAVLTLLAAVACSEPLEFADWTIPVPEGVRVHEHVLVSLEERAGHRIEVVEDLVLGRGDRRLAPTSGDPHQAFYRPRTVVPDADGNIYVLDQGNRRVQVFDADGQYLRTLGREGQGPGEMTLPTSLAITADRVVVRVSRRRLNMWALDGSHIADVLIDEDPHSLVGMDEGFVARQREWLGELAMEAPPTRRFTFLRYDADGQQAMAYVHVDEPPTPGIGWVGARSEFFAGVLLERGGMLPTFIPRHAASRDGTLYLTTSDEYQIQAYGSRRWALRVAWSRAPVTAEAIEAEMSLVPEALAGATPSELGFPEHFPAIAGMRVDGHGHVYVFPFHPQLDARRPQDAERGPKERPVDVYSADGEHLFSGLIDLGAWSGAHGDFVFNLRRDPVTEEDEAVRYRLVEPF